MGCNDSCGGRGEGGANVVTRTMIVKVIVTVLLKVAVMMMTILAQLQYI